MFGASHQKLNCQKKWVFYNKILYFFSSGFSISRRLALSKLSRGGNTPPSYFSLAFLHAFQQKLSKMKKVAIFFSQFNFLFARTLCKNLALNGEVLFSQFGYSRFSSVPTKIWEKSSTKQKIKKMTPSY